MPTPFIAQIRHWPTLDAFLAYMRSQSRPKWVRGITNHNTYIPNELQWRGLASVESCRQTYIGRGWTTGPHLFVAATAPNLAHTGIFQLTPITVAGTHAGQCNDDCLGIEHVGDFDARPPTPAQYGLLLDLNRALLQIWGLDPATVNVHNECMAGRTCPGKHLTGAMIRRDLTKPTPPRPTWRRYEVVEACTVLTARAGNAPLAPGPTRLPAGRQIHVGDVTSGWLWVSEDLNTEPGIGFIPESYARAL